MWDGRDFLLFVKSYEPKETEDLELAFELFVDNHILISTKKKMQFSVSSTILIV